MSIDTFQSLVVLAIGFAMAGLLASVFQLTTQKPPSFELLHGAPPRALASIPFLVFAAPFIIIRNIIRDEGGHRSFVFVTLATIVAGFWSLMSGTAVVMALEAIGVLGA